MIGIIEYGSGNIGAISNLLSQQNISHNIVTKPEDILISDKLILPGVSAFDTTMKLLKHKKIIEVLNFMVLEKKTPILGICVGMQVMFEKSEEGLESGLGWFEGEVKQINNLKLPHMGWNSIESNILNEPFLKDVNLKKGFYFLHSFKCVTHNKMYKRFYAYYNDQINAIVINNNIYGVQFHPEKSHENGIQIFKNFAKL